MSAWWRSHQRPSSPTWSPSAVAQRRPASTPKRRQSAPVNSHDDEKKPPLAPLPPAPQTAASSSTTVERRLALGELVGGPQPGEAAADDADVGLGRAGERRTGRAGVGGQRLGRASSCA